jgi:Tfp pilus assembly protein PilN
MALRYNINLMKAALEAERRDSKLRFKMALIFIVCFGALGGAAIYAYAQLSLMEQTLYAEKMKLRKVEAEYRNYQEEVSVVNKADVELLGRLQTNRIYWTRKLDAMARYLPDEEPISYWITKFGYNDNNKTFTVNGYGYITQRQEQLLELERYLDSLRAESSYAYIFGTTYLKSAVRSDELFRTDGARRDRDRDRVSFEYASVRKGAETK